MTRNNKRRLAEITGAFPKPVAVESQSPRARSDFPITRSTDLSATSTLSEKHHLIGIRQLSSSRTAQAPNPITFLISEAKIKPYRPRESGRKPEKRRICLSETRSRICLSTANQKL